MSAFWKAICKKLGTSLLTNTAYHPQTDGISERTNQTVEIALRFQISQNNELNWVTSLSALQAGINNAQHAITDFSPNEIVYGFKVREAVSLLGAESRQDHEVARQLYQREAGEAIAFANVKAKAYYDSKHKPLFLQPGEQALLRLHKGYNLPGQPNPKLSKRDESEDWRTSWSCQQIGRFILSYQ